MFRPPDTAEIFFGCNTPSHRFRMVEGVKVWVDINNETLHPTDDEFEDGTYGFGALLGTMCRRYCRPHRSAARAEPCPAFVKSYQFDQKDGQLASVEMHAIPQWEKCAGFRRLVETCQQDYEGAFLRAYVNDRFGDEMGWRDNAVTAWNNRWSAVPNTGFATRRDKFESLIWHTLRFPALIPQVWLNWVGGAPDHLQKHAERNPSRVDFIAFWGGQRHVIEIDGPTHWAGYDGQGYVPNEEAYKRTVVIQRSLRHEGWQITPLSRLEVQEAMQDRELFMPWLGVLDVLPFYQSEYAPLPTYKRLGLVEITPSSDPVAAFSDDDIPF